MPLHFLSNAGAWAPLWPPEPGNMDFRKPLWLVLLCSLCWRLCPVPGTLSLGFPVGGAGGSSGPVGCYEAGHRAESQGFWAWPRYDCFPRHRQQPSQREGDQGLTAKGKSLRPPCTLRCGGLAIGKSLTAKAFVVPYRDWGRHLTSGLLKWAVFVLLPSCLVALGCWVALPLLWVSPLRGELRKAPLKCPCWRMLSSYSILLWSNLWFGEENALAGVVNSFPVSLKSYALSQGPLGFPRQVPWLPSKICSLS